MSTQTLEATSNSNPEVATAKLDVDVLQENLVRGLNTVRLALPKSKYGALPIITDRALVATDRGRLRLTATDLNLTVSTLIGARVQAEGAVTLPVSTTLAAAKAAGKTGPLAIIDNGTLRMTGGRGSTTLARMDPQDYPRITRIEEPSGEWILPAAELAEALTYVIRAAATDDSRPVLAGVYFEVSEDGTVGITAADGFRLAHAEIKVVDPVYGSPVKDPVTQWTGIVSMPVIKALHTLLTRREFTKNSFENPVMRVNATSVEFELGNGDETVVSGPQIQGTYPNYRQLRPSECNGTVTFTVSDFKPNLQAANNVAKDGSGIIRLTPKDTGYITVSAHADELADYEAVCPATLDGDPSKIAFNSRYLSDMLACSPSETLTLRLLSTKDQGVFEPDGYPGWYHAVMPMFVEW